MDTEWLRVSARSLILRAVLAGCLAIALLAVTAGPAIADVVTFGSSLPPPSPGYYDSCTASCTAAQIELHGAPVTSPIAGTVVRIRLRTDAGSDPQMIHFRIIHSEDGKKFSAIATSKAFPLSTSAGITEYAVAMPIHEGDYIGIDQSANVKAHIIRADGNAFQAGWFPKLSDGKPPRASGNPKGSAPTQYELLLQADVQPIQGEPHSTCTNAQTLIATCTDPHSLPSVCGPGAIFPQCHLPVDLPMTCGGLGSGLPACQLPRNEVVACGSLGIGLGVPACGKLPPQRVPQVCGPTGAGLPLCSLANNLVTACGPVALGFPACNFTSFIKAPLPANLTDEGAAIDATVTPPDSAKHETGHNTVTMTVDLQGAVAGHRAALALYAAALSRYFGDFDIMGYEALLQGYSEDQVNQALAHNTKEFFRRAIYWLDLELSVAEANGRSGRITRLDEESVLTIYESLLLRDSVHGSYLGPDFLFFNDTTGWAGENFSEALADAIDDLARLSNPPASQRHATLGQVQAAGVAFSSARRRPLLERRFRLRRNRRNRVHIRLSKKVVRALVKQAPRRARAAPVRLVLTFKAKPRPIVRVIDFPIRIKRRHGH
jgi:hypothetical protein